MGSKTAVKFYKPYSPRGRKSSLPCCTPTVGLSSTQK